MPRITCRTPSTGKPIRVSLKDVTTELQTISEAPDFSVPDASESFPNRDPNDASRAIRPGEIFFLTPLSAKNKTDSTQWIEVVLLAEDNSLIELGKVDVPSGDTAFIPIQGRSLFKRDPSGTYGDRLQIRCSEDYSFDVWTAAEEKLSSEHTGVV